MKQTTEPKKKHGGDIMIDRPHCKVQGTTSHPLSNPFSLDSYRRRMLTGRRFIKYSQ